MAMNAVFFDMDGTLFDTKADLAATVNHTRRDLGLAELPVDEVLSHVGQGANYLMTHAIPEKAEAVDEVLQLFRGHYAEHCCDTVQPYPGVRRTLAELRDRGWLLGVNTNKPRFATIRILEHFGFTGYFGDAIVAGGDCQEMKPNSGTLRECAARLHGHRLSAYDWMVGDSWQDLKCAENAGIKSAFCTFGFGRLNDAHYTVRISRFEELLRHLKAEE